MIGLDQSKRSKQGIFSSVSGLRPLLFSAANELLRISHKTVWLVLTIPIHKDQYISSEMPIVEKKFVESEGIQHSRSITVFLE
ncbi:hypothetical protein TNCV_2479851 [Trichonephila clavipes]|nr:hypothetical protein TNCV_2479851 [Trichonephila clavipes]